jgi:hypothetical protein
MDTETTESEETKKRHALEAAALELIGAAKHTLEHLDWDTHTSQDWAKKILDKLSPVLGR